MEYHIFNSIRTARSKEQNLTLLWCPSHYDVWGNEEADMEAASGREMDYTAVTAFFSTAKAAIHRHNYRRAIHHSHFYADENNNIVYPHTRISPVTSKWSSADSEQATIPPVSYTHLTLPTIYSV